MWVRRPRLTHTTSQGPLPQEGRTTIGNCFVPRPRHRNGVDMPDAGLHQHREAMHKQHTQSGSSCCAPFGDPHVHNVTPSYNTSRECSHSSANTMGTSPPYGEDTPDRRPIQRKEKGGGYISNMFCANTDLCPLASPRVALVGVRLLRHPDNGNTR